MNSKIVKSVAIVLVGILLIFGLVAVSKGSSKKKPAPNKNAIPTITVEELRKKIKFSETRAKNVGGKYEITGAVQNQDTFTRSFKIRGVFVDKEHQVVAKVPGEIKDLKPNETRPYTVVSETPFVAFEIYVVEVASVN